MGYPLRITEPKLFWTGTMVLFATAFLCIAIPGPVAAQNQPAQVLVSEFIFTQAGFEQCHASTIDELPGGDLMAAWFGGRREGDKSVAIWGSRRHEGTWSDPVVLAREPDVPCWNPVLFRNDDKLWLFYKVGPSPREWTGAFVLSDGRAAAWGSPTYFPAGILGPIKNKPIVLSNGDIVCGTSVESYNAWSCWVEISTDRGSSWRKFGPIVVPGQNDGIIQPTVWETKPGHLKMLVRATKAIGFICESESADGGRTWSPAKPTGLPNPNSGIDAVKMKDGTIALVYNHTQQGRTPLDIAFSKDDGRTWSPPMVLEDEPGEYSYPAVIQGRDGKLHVTYTWKRKLIKHVVVARP